MGALIRDGTQNTLVDLGVLMEFHSGRALREAAEAQIGHRLTADEWATVDPTGWSGMPSAYDYNDLDELRSAIANRFPRQTGTSDERVRAAARDRTQRTAREDVRELVEDERYGLFDARAAPFRTVADAARWIEDQQAAPERVRLALTVDLREQDLGVELLRDLRDWLDRVLETSGPDATYADFLRDADGLHSIGSVRTQGKRGRLWSVRLALFPEPGGDAAVPAASRTAFRSSSIVRIRSARGWTETVEWSLRQFTEDTDDCIDGA